MKRATYIVLTIAIFLFMGALSCGLYRQDPLTAERSPNGTYDAIVTLDIRFGKPYRTYVVIEPVKKLNLSEDNVAYAEDSLRLINVKWISNDTLLIKGVGKGKILTRRERVLNIVINTE